MNVALLSQPQRELRAYLQRVAGDGGIVETPGEASTFVRRLRSAGVLGSTVIAGVAGGVKAGTLYSIIGPDLDVTRGTVKNRVNRAGVLSEVASGVPATDFAGGVLRGTTVEPSAVNVLLRSEEFDNATIWANSISGTGLTPVRTANAGVAPDGTMTADRLIFNLNGGTTVNDFSQILQSSTIISPNISSVYVKSFDGSTYTIRLDIGGGDIVLFTVTNQWQRVLVPTTVTANSSFRIGLRGAGQSDVADVLLWGAQRETGSVATSYIKTEGSAQTRNADVITKTGLGSVLPQTEGAVYCEVTTRNIGSNRRFLDLATDANNTRVTIQKGNGNDTFQLAVIDGGVAQALISGSAGATGTFKIAGAYKANDFVLYINGVQIGVDASGTVPPLASVGIGCSITGGAQCNDNIHSFSIFDKRLTNAQLQALTTL
jgi:hypothetical protein